MINMEVPDDIVCHFSTPPHAKNRSPVKKLFILKKYSKKHWSNLLLLIIFVLIVSLWCVHINYVIKQLESPLDHLPSNVLKPFYRLQCPDMSETMSCRMPRMLMMSARPSHLKERFNSALSWSSEKIEIINTTALTLDYVNTKCDKMTFGNRLFYIYREVFKQVLIKHPEDMDFIFLEDDAVLLDASALKSETCHARANGLNFYSLVNTKSQGDSCVYEFGMVATYIRREMVEHLSQVGADQYCRKPIDIYLAASGPWFASVNKIVNHNATRRFNNIYR